MIVFTTLAEGHYFLGVAGLINTIIKHGTYGDKIIVGYRGDLPSWLPKLSKSKNGFTFQMKKGFIVEFVEVQGSLHMVHEKPRWFRYLIEELEPSADEYFFFDSDIVVINRMSFFGEWVKQGVAICEDVNYDMGLTHPIRQQWVKVAGENNMEIVNLLTRYFNSGFLGWTRINSEFVLDWDKCCQIMGELGGDMKKFRVTDRTSMVLSANQDSLNLAAMVTKRPISVIGPQAMGFHFGLRLMQHPLGPKPWKRSFFKDALRGIPPRAADITFWNSFIGSELKPYSTSFIKWKLTVVKLCKLLSRFYSQRQV